jgi:hypothetical protein
MIGPATLPTADRKELSSNEDEKGQHSKTSAPKYENEMHCGLMRSKNRSTDAIEKEQPATAG